ncbi:hypothetical protein Vretimale_3125 [Volvox reticuliferus]|uniref:DUF1499 domain-containing protein n=1 Tax=Volvox reticuliferus TaxID=1737510 RepID=A0A8J4DB90_9CHLO|nr:hypothetical protein Vretimale_3125 [Volvox reticuliferus]
MRIIQKSFILAVTTVGAFHLLVPRSVKMAFFANLVEMARAPVLNDVSTDLEDPPSYIVAQHGPLPEHWKPRIRAAYPYIQPLRILLPATPNRATILPLETALPAVISEASPTIIPAPAAKPILDALIAVANAMPQWHVERVIPDIKGSGSADAADAEATAAVASGPDAILVEAVATTRLLKFKDDVVVRVRPERGSTAAAELDVGASASAGQEAVVLRVDVRSTSRVGKGDLAANARRIRMFLDKLRTELEQRGLKVATSKP